MNPAHPLKLLAAVAVAVLAASLTLADVVETKDGARLVGTVTGIADGVVTLKTDYAGKIEIKQAEVVRIETKDPLFVRLTGGTTLAATMSSPEAGAVELKGSDGRISTTVDKLSTTWPPGATDPAILALQRKWDYEATVDVTGKTGNREQLGTSFGFRAKLSGPEDTFLVYTAYDRQVTDGVKSADQFKAGVDYSNHFSGRFSWYVRDEGGFDRVKDIEFYNIAAAGIGYDFVKNRKQTLTGRTGIAFRYEDYGNPLTEDVKSAGMDFGLIHSYTFTDAKMNNALTYIPAFEDYTNYRATHDSNFEMPIGVSGYWKLRVGVTNDYTSQPGPGIEKLDTTYYTRLVLDWQE